MIVSIQTAILLYQEPKNKLSLNNFQGRLPVRWMAIESLNYSVYTTNSDV